MLERHELVEKQFWQQKEETHNSLPNALGTQRCTVLDLHLSSIVMMMTKKCFILTSQVKSTENPITTSVCNVYYTDQKL
jgi:hypothetical protein